MNKRMRKWFPGSLALVLLVASGYLLRAQNEGGPPPGDPPDAADVAHPGEPNFHPPDPARMREMMLERIKEELKATAEEWSVMKPLIAEIMKLRMSQRSGGPGLMGPRPGASPAGLDGTPPVGMMGTPSPEMEALKKAADSASISNKELKAKLQAYREARQKNEQALKDAREKLRAVLTVRQEAKLVLVGLLD